MAAEASGAWIESDWTNALRRYTDQHVKMSKGDTKNAKEVYTPLIQVLLREINRRDPRFDCQPLQTGSSSQGLKVDKPDEFDVNVKLCRLGELSWQSVSVAQAKTRRYGFNVGSEIADPAKSFPNGREVVQSTSANLPQPPTGFCFVSVKDDSVAWRESDMVVRNDVIPYLVKRHFKRMIDEMKTDNDLRSKLGQIQKTECHGPAIQMKIRPPKLDHDIDVDVVPFIESKLPIPEWVRWPRKKRKWPSEDKVAVIKKIGINLVPKRNFYWMLSFGNMEKELMDNIDKDDAGCRKQIHRITKMMLKDIWCKTTNPVITSYHLKNVLFWECEDHPDPGEWHMDRLGTRLRGVAMRLSEAVKQRHLKLYFYDKINLFEEKRESDLDIVGKKIDEFLKNPSKYLKLK